MGKAARLAFVLVALLVSALLLVEAVATASDDTVTLSQR
jgi:hypothetical protein